MPLRRLAFIALTAIFIISAFAGILAATSTHASGSHLVMTGCEDTSCPPPADSCLVQCLMGAVNGEQAALITPIVTFFLSALVGFFLFTHPTSVRPLALAHAPPNRDPMHLLSVRKRE